METVFAAGDSVVCVYTDEGYDATVTLRSWDEFRIDQQTQGGLEHVIRGAEKTYVWIDGMTQVMEFDTVVYDDDSSGMYPAINPVDLDAAIEVDPTGCDSVPTDDALYELPSGLAIVEGPG